MRYAAFLRAINVGAHNRIKMSELRDLCAAAGLGGVTTYLQTGNLLFDVDADAESAAVTIEAALAARGLRNATAVVRTADELAALLATDAFASFPAERFTRYVTLFRSPLPAEVRAVENEFVHLVRVREREILAAMPLERPQGVDLNATLSKSVRLDGTTRYWHVVEAVARLLG